MATDDNDTPFPWDLDIYDAHCHPTDTMSSISTIQSMKTRILTVMGTRAQDQELVASVAETHGIQSDNPSDWKDHERIVPCFGWHPWFSYQMYLPEESDTATEAAQPISKKEEPLQGDDKIKHYQSVLQPHRPDPSDEEIRIFQALPDPLPFSHFLSSTRARLQAHSFALVGEIGLDRSFRIPEPWVPEGQEQRDEGLTPGGREGRRLTPFRVDMKHQKAVFELQLRLAAELNRAVSVHGVQAHGVVFETLRELYKGHENKVLSKRERKKQSQDHVAHSDHEAPPPEKSKPYPPRVCLHSYSGTPGHFKQYKDPSIPIEIFVSFSSAINLSGEGDGDLPAEFEDMINEVPDRMLLVESDLHVAGEIMDRHMEDIVQKICRVKGWGLEEGVRILGRNWRRFVFGME